MARRGKDLTVAWRGGWLLTVDKDHIYINKEKEKGHKVITNRSIGFYLTDFHKF